MAIRKGNKQDLPRVLELIKELALYEKAPQEVVVSVDEMVKWGPDGEGIYDFFVLENEKGIVGISVYYFKYSTWQGKCLFLEDIIVTESERGKGYGKILFDATAKLAKELKVRRMEWQVLDWNEPAIAFYKKYKAVMDGEWINCKLTFDQLQNF
ncbi:MAG TPA: GNAT family N-acetyltransferase [Bacteroidia bacterium]|nr:GNAT family N-acetyltransferase [Bacteroidia bacterium]